MVTKNSNIRGTVIKNTSISKNHTRRDKPTGTTLLKTQISKTTLETSKTWIELNLKEFLGKFCPKLWVLTSMVIPLSLCKLYLAKEVFFNRRRVSKVTDSTTNQNTRLARTKVLTLPRTLVFLSHSRPALSQMNKNGSRQL
jgi:hypothetical protein